MIDHIWTTRRAESKTFNPKRLPVLGNFSLGLYAYNVARLELKTFAVYSPPQERLRCGLMSLMAIAPLVCSSLAPKGMFLDVSLPTRGVFFCAALLSICWLGLSALRYARFRFT